MRLLLFFNFMACCALAQITIDGWITESEYKPIAVKKAGSGGTFINFALDKLLYYPQNDAQNLYLSVIGRLNPSATPTQSISIIIGFSELDGVPPMTNLNIFNGTTFHHLGRSTGNSLYAPFTAQFAICIAHTSPTAVGVAVGDVRSGELSIINSTLPTDGTRYEFAGLVIGNGAVAYRNTGPNSGFEARFRYSQLGITMAGHVSVWVSGVRVDTLRDGSSLPGSLPDFNSDNAAYIATNRQAITAGPVSLNLLATHTPSITSSSTHTRSTSRSLTVTPPRTASRSPSRSLSRTESRSRSPVATVSVPERALFLAALPLPLSGRPTHALPCLRTTC